MLAMGHGQCIVDKLCKKTFKRGSGQVRALLWDKEVFRMVASEGLSKVLEES